jgi:hypothetical protein
VKSWRISRHDDGFCRLAGSHPLDGDLRFFEPDAENLSIELDGLKLSIAAGKTRDFLKIGGALLQLEDAVHQSCAPGRSGFNSEFLGHDDRTAAEGAANR